MVIIISFWVYDYSQISHITVVSNYLCVTWSNICVSCFRSVFLPNFRTSNLLTLNCMLLLICHCCNLSKQSCKCRASSIISILYWSFKSSVKDEIMASRPSDYRLKFTFYLFVRTARIFWNFQWFKFEILCLFSSEKELAWQVLLYLLFFVAYL